MDQKSRVGEKIREIRELQGLTPEELSERSGSSVEVINAIEAGELVPSLTPLMKLARGLGVRLGTFLDDMESRSPVIVRQGKSDDVVRFAGDTGVTESTLDLTPLGAGKSDRHMEPFIVQVHPPQSKTHDLSSHDGEEFIYVLSGEIEIFYGKDVHKVSAGDSIYYDSIVPHHLHAANGTDATILAVVYAPF
jgi:transcriptional regulator with XRE-family HTH domain